MGRKTKEKIHDLHDPDHDPDHPAVSDGGSTMSSNSCLTAAIKELANVGIHHPEIAHGGKHMQLRWINPRGERRVFAVPGTPSDWRSVENTRHDLRRILARDGMLETASPRPPPPGNQTGSSCWNGAWPRSSDGS